MEPDLRKINNLLKKNGAIEHERALRILNLNNFLEGNDIDSLTDEKLKIILDGPLKNLEQKKLIVNKLKSDFEANKNLVEEAARVLKDRINKELFVVDGGEKFKDYLKNQNFARSAKYVLGSDSIFLADHYPERDHAQKFITDCHIGVPNEENSSILSNLIIASIQENKGKVKKLVREVDQEKIDREWRVALGVDPADRVRELEWKKVDGKNSN